MFRTISSLFNLNLTAVLYSRWHQNGKSAKRLLGWFWKTNRHSAEPVALTPSERRFTLVLSLGMLAQVAVGIGFLIEWARYGTVGAWEFGAALVLSYPVVWAHVFMLGVACAPLLRYARQPKKLGREIVCRKLESQVRELRKRHDFKVVAVAGSVGKTSTKLAVAELLSKTKRVRYQTGNYNDRVTVPLVFFGHDEPNILNIFAWFRMFRANQAVIAAGYPYDIVVVELGTDAPGSIREFAYIEPDITVLTAVSPEHMEFFGTVDAVAEEELAVFGYSRRVLVNGDDIAGAYLAGREFTEYSLESRQAGYFAATKPNSLEGQSLTVTTPTGKLKADVQYIGAQGAKFALAAAATADMLGLSRQVVEDGLPQLSHFSGRMQVLRGIDGSTLIDDTYNASPLACKAALDVLYAAKTPQRIVILGSMNELGGYSQQAHAEVGAYCDAKKLDVVVTVGADAEVWLAPAAKAAGCEVISFKSPYDAGDYVKSRLRKDAVVLAKGSQNGVFAEEALKVLLADGDDITKLVRQSPYWLEQKQIQFGLAPVGLLPNTTD